MVSKFVLFSFLVVFVNLMHTNKFEKCNEKKWCERLRNKFEKGKHVVESIHSHSKFVSGVTRDGSTNDRLFFQVDSFGDGVIRLMMYEDGLRNFKNKKFRQQFDDDFITRKTVPFDHINNGKYQIRAKTKNTEFVLFRDREFRLDFLVDGVKYVTFNEKNFLQMESYFYKKGPNDTWSEGERNGVSLDLTFNFASQIYGIPERSMRLALEDTKSDGEPYRLFNLDIYEYELKNKIGIYGNIPYLMTMNKQGLSVGMFYLNPAEHFIDVERDGSGINTRWMSSNGLLNIFFIPGPTPKDVISRYVKLTGLPPLPPKFSTAYHQCRWNYKDEDDVKQVNQQFDNHDIPYDVIWLDIEHTDSKKYFTWDKDLFPNPKRMIDHIASFDRKMVTISDPHIKNEQGYFVYDQAKTNSFFVKDKNGGIYTGDCWPGKSSWLDFLNPTVRDWYSDCFLYHTYKGSTENLYTWIDMNEPSVFSGPEISMDLDAKHHNDMQHREVHNVYGYYHAMATYEGHLRRAGGGKGRAHQPPNTLRPFILTRSFFGGTQRYAAVWTGDNAATWEQLEISVPMLLALGVSGLSFVGADVGGFFKDPEPELLVRWYALGALYPFFRAHANFETKRREPWLFGEKVTASIRKAIARRYVLLDYIYTEFWRNSISGLPIFKPLVLDYASDEETHSMDQEFLLGPDLLCRPVTSKQEHDNGEVEVYFPKGKWYDYQNGHLVSKGKHKMTIRGLTIDSLPLYQRGGSVIPQKRRLRRNSKQMQNDPYTLQIALDTTKFAYGELYIDDELTFNYDLEKNPQYTLKKFFFHNNVIISNSTVRNFKQFTNTIERILVFGFNGRPKKIVLKDLEQSSKLFDTQVILKFQYDPAKRILTIRKPDVNVLHDFRIEIHV